MSQVSSACSVVHRPYGRQYRRDIGEFLRVIGERLQLLGFHSRTNLVLTVFYVPSSILQQCPGDKSHVGIAGVTLHSHVN